VSRTVKKEVKLLRGGESAGGGRLVKWGTTVGTRPKQESRRHQKCAHTSRKNRESAAVLGRGTGTAGASAVGEESKEARC